MEGRLSTDNLLIWAEALLHLHDWHLSGDGAAVLTDEVYCMDVESCINPNGFVPLTDEQHSANATASRGGCAAGPVARLGDHAQITRSIPWPDGMQQSGPPIL